MAFLEFRLLTLCAHGTTLCTKTWQIGPQGGGLTVIPAKLSNRLFIITAGLSKHCMLW